MYHSAANNYAIVQMPNGLGSAPVKAAAASGITQPRRLSNLTGSFPGEAFRSAKARTQLCRGKKRYAEGGPTLAQEAVGSETNLSDSLRV